MLFSKFDSGHFTGTANKKFEKHIFRISKKNRNFSGLVMFIKTGSIPWKVKFDLPSKGRALNLDLSKRFNILRSRI